MFLTRFLGLSSKSSQIAPPSQIPRLKSRLGCEMLEARDVPAAFYWNPLGGSDLLASTANNWTDGVSSRYSTPPGTAADLYFPGHPVGSSSGPSYPSAPATIDSGGVFKSIHIYDYGLSVTTSVDVTVETLELRRGNIVQQNAASNGGKLTITSRFDWTGGDLNPDTSSPAGPTVGLVTLSGATGLINPGDGTTLNLGTQFVVDSGAFVTQASGGISLLKDNGFDILNGTFLCQAKGQPVGILPTLTAAGNVTYPKNAVQVNQGGKLRVENSGNQAAATYNLDKTPLQNLGGEVTIGERLVLQSSATISDVLTTENCSIYQSSGVFNLAHGSTVSVTKGIKFDGGDFFTTTAETVAGNAIPDAVIEGNFIFRAGTVTLVKNSTETGVIGNLRVSGGNVWFYSGTFKPVLDCGVNGVPVPANEANPNRISKFTTTGTFTFDASKVKVEPRKLNFGAPQMRDGRTWDELLHGDKGMTVIVGPGSGGINDPLAGTNFVFAEALDWVAGEFKVVGYKLKWKSPN